MRSGFSPDERLTIGWATVVSSIVPLNSTMIAVALPDVARDFAVRRGSAAVLVTAYLLAMALCQPFAGRLGDRYGSRRVAAVALGGFGAASVVAAVAPSFPALVAARTLQALFGSALIPNVQAIVRASVADERRGRSFGILGSGIGAGAAVGPLVGGLLLEVGGWPAIFVANAPVVVAAAVLARRLPPSAAPSVGAVLGFGVLRRARFVAACGSNAASTLSLYSVLLVLPLILDARGWSAGSTGLALSCLTVGMLVLAPVGGWLGDRAGRTPPVVAGMVILAVGCSVLVFGFHSPVALVGGALVVGVGMGIANASLQTAALEAVPPEAAGAAAGVFSTARYAGSILGSVIIAAAVSEAATGARPVLVVTVAAAVVAAIVGSLVESGSSPEEAAAPAVA